MTAEASDNARPSAQTRWLSLVPLVGLAISVATSAVYGLPTGLIVVGATFLLVAIANIWVSLQLLAGDRPSVDEGFDAGAPSTEQEQKAFLLRALEDLEFEHAVGKIDDADYAELRDKYRDRVKQVLSLSKGPEYPMRERAEALVQDYLQRQQIAATSQKVYPQAKDNPGDEPVEQRKEDTSSRDGANPTCPACSTRNDCDAAFCKRCGHAIDNPGAKEGASD